MGAIVVTAARIGNQLLVIMSLFLIILWPPLLLCANVNAIRRIGSPLSTRYHQQISPGWSLPSNFHGLPHEIIEPKTKHAKTHKIKNWNGWTPSTLPSSFGDSQFQMAKTRGALTGQSPRPRPPPKQTPKQWRPLQTRQGQPQYPAPNSRIYRPKSPKHKHKYPLQSTQFQKPSSCRDGFELLLSDLGLLSLLLSTAGVGLDAVSVIVSAYYLAFANYPSLTFVGVPSLIVNALSLVGFTFSGSSPFIIYLTLASILDALNNLFSVTPGSTYITFISLISLIISKTSVALGVATSFPQIMKKVLDELGLKRFIDKTYGCGELTPGKLLEDFFDMFYDDDD